jgi:hypothetical protein
MRVLGGFFAETGDQVRLNVSDVEGSVEVFIGVLERFADDGGGIDTKWLPNQLESTAGGQAALGDAHGYNVVIVPVVIGQSTMNVRLRATGSVTEDRSSVVTVDTNEPLGWRIFIK